RWVRWGGSVGVRQVGESSGPGDTGSARAITRNSERGTRNSCSRSAVQQLFRLRLNVLDRQPQLLIDPLVRRGCPEPLDTEHDAAVTYPAIPGLRARGFDGDARAHARGDHRVAVLLRLPREQLHGRHAHGARDDSGRTQTLEGTE